MRQAENTGSGPVSANDRAASPIKVGAVVLAAALAAWGLLWLTTRPDEPKGGRADPGPAFDLTDSEAIETLSALSSVALKAQTERQLGEISHVYTSDGPASSRARKDITRLLDSNVIDKTSTETIELSVVSNQPDEVVIQEVRRVHPCFVTERGRDVTADHSVIEERALWTLRQSRGEWLIHDHVVEGAEEVKGAQNDGCA